MPPEICMYVRTYLFIYLFKVCVGFKCYQEFESILLCPILTIGGKKHFHDKNRYADDMTTSALGRQK